MYAFFGNSCFVHRDVMQMARWCLVIPDILDNTVVHTKCSKLPEFLMKQMRIWRQEQKQPEERREGGKRIKEQVNTTNCYFWCGETGWEGAGHLSILHTGVFLRAGPGHGKQGKKAASTARYLRLRSWLCHFLDVDPWMSYFFSNVCFLICRTDTIVMSTPQD